MEEDSPYVVSSLCSSIADLQRQEPMNLVEKTAKAQRTLRALLANQAVREIAGFGNGEQ